MIFVMLAVGFLALFLYPFLIYPLILLLFPKKPIARSRVTGDHSLRTALVFCAYNEERSLPDKLANLRALKAVMPDLQISAYSDGSTDRTVEILQSASDIVDVHIARERRGKAVGMAYLIVGMDADILICTDANVTIDAETLPRILEYFSDPEVGCVAGRTLYINPDEGQTAEVGTLYWRLEEWIKKLESETGSTMGATGSNFALRRSLYCRVPESLVDDMALSISVLFENYRVVQAPDVFAYERSTTDSRDEFRRKRRIACRAFNTHRHLAPKLRTMKPIDRFKYVSHKYLRWLSALWLLLFAVFATLALDVYFGPIVAVVALVAGATCFAVGYLLPVPLLGMVAEIVVSVVAVGIGLCESLAGHDYQTWNPPKSR